MKPVILLLMILFTLVSCGEKNDTGKASFKLSIGSIVNATSAYFPGGLLITGHRIDGTQSFSLAYTNGLELELKKGAWEFATIGWTDGTNGVMTGPQQCSYQQIELRDDNQIVTFNMNASNCRTSTALGGKKFTDSEFFKLTNGSGTIGFKKLALSVCATLDASGNCSLAYSSSTLNSFKVSLPASLEGITLNAAPMLISSCVPISGGYAYSSLTLPHGGKAGFLRTDIAVYNSSDCTGVSSQRTYPHGLGEPISGFSTMSMSSMYSYINGLRYLGEWSTGPTNPTAAGHLKGDIFLVTTSSISSPSANTGDTIYFDGANWINIYAIMTLLDGKVYFDSDAYTYLFVKQ